jgi:hypothetical protein
MGVENLKNFGLWGTIEDAEFEDIDQEKEKILDDYREKINSVMEQNEISDERRKKIFDSFEKEVKRGKNKTDIDISFIKAMSDINPTANSEKPTSPEVETAKDDLETQMRAVMEAISEEEEKKLKEEPDGSENPTSSYPEKDELWDITENLQNNLRQAKKENGQTPESPHPEIISQEKKRKNKKKIKTIESKITNLKTALERTKKRKAKEKFTQQIEELEIKRDELKTDLEEELIMEQPPLTTEELRDMEPILEEEIKETQEQINSMDEKDKKSLYEGLANIGFRTTEWKSKVFSKMFHGLADKIDKDKKSTTAKFFDHYANSYDKTGAQAKKQRETIGKGQLSKFSGSAQGVGNVFRYGRVVYDLVSQFSGSGLNPFRHATAIALLAGRLSSASKETRLNSDSVKEKTRAKVNLSKEEGIEGFATEEDEKNYERAAEEAWAIYEKAKQENGELTAKDLDKAYKDNLPKNILDRLNRFDGNKKSFVSGMFEALLNKDIKPAVVRIKNSIEKIEKENLSKEEKEKKIQDVLRRNELFLNDLDRIVGDQGTLDQIAYWSRMGEVIGKDVATVLIVDSVARLACGSIKLFHLAENFTKEAETDKLNTDLLSPDEKIAEAVKKAKGIQGLKQAIADKFGLNIEDLKDVDGDKDISETDIAQIQAEKLGVEVHQPLSAETFETLQNEKDLLIVQRIMADGTPSEAELNILKSNLDNEIKLAILGNPATQAENLENIEKLRATNPEILKGLSEIIGKEGITKMAQIPKGGNVSEALEKVMAEDSAITVINPDGTKILNFDANLVHPDDTIIEAKDGEIIVLKTSGTAVEEGMSLEGIYEKIQTNLDKEGVPQEVQSYFNTNRAEPGWLGKIDAIEAKTASNFWKKYGEKINKLTEEKREKFYENTDLNNPEEVEKQLTTLTEETKGETIKEAREEFKRKIEEEIVGGIEKEIPKMEVFAGHENLNQDTYEKVINDIAKRGLSIQQNNEMILNWSREVSILKSDLEKLELTPSEAQEKLDRIKDIMETSKNTYHTDIFNQDTKDFVNNYKPEETLAVPKLEEIITQSEKPEVTPSPQEAPGKPETKIPQETAETNLTPTEDFSALDQNPLAEFPQDKLVFGDSFPAEDRADFEKFFNSGLEQRQEIIKQLDDWRERYGDRPEFAKFEAGVTEEINLRNNVLENMAKEAATGTSNNGTIKVIKSQVGNLPPDKSADLVLRTKSGLAKLQTREEGAEDAFKELNKATENISPVEKPTVPLRPEEVITQPEESSTPPHPEEAPVETKVPPEKPSGTPKHDFKKFEVSQKETQGDKEFVRVERVVSDDFQSDLTGKENLNMEEINKLDLSDDQIKALKLNSRVISGRLAKLETIDHNSPEAQTLRNTIRQTIKINERAYGKDIFAPEIKNILEAKPESSSVSEVEEAISAQPKSEFTQELIKNSFSENEEISSDFKNVMSKEFGVADVKQQYLFNTLLVGKNNEIAKHYLEAQRAEKAEETIENMKNYLRWFLEEKGGKSYSTMKNVGSARITLNNLAAQYPFKPEIDYGLLLKSK